MQKEKTIDHQLRATWQSITRMYNEQALKYDSTMATAYLLLNIDTKNGTPSTALGPQMGMEATSLSRILNKIEEKGLITREKNPNDGRSVLVKLTEKGKETRKISKATVIKFNNTVHEHVSEDKLKTFFEVIDTINQLIDKKIIFKNNF